MKGSRKMVLLLIASVLLVFPLKVSFHAQQAPPRTAVPGFYNELEKNAAATRRGEATFYQRCSLCHLPRIRKPATTPGPAPSLAGVLKGADRELENRARDFIMKGSDRMPGWQYSLKPAEMDDLMTYLRTL